MRRVGIVGGGLIGRSIELALGRLGEPPDIAVLDRGDDLARLAGVELVVLAAPGSQNLEILANLPAYLTGDTLITDTGSTKREIVETAAALPDRFCFIGGHPMAGAERSGPDAARADLFDGKPWIVTPSAGASPADLARLKAFVESVGAKPNVMEAADHDRLVAFTSHLPQLAVSALMHVAGTAAGQEGLTFAGSGLRDSTRLAASPAALWQEIVTSNRANVDDALDAFIAALQQLREDQDGRALEETFSSAAAWKQTLDRSRD